MSESRKQPAPISRRRFLGNASVLGLGAALTSCSSEPGESGSGGSESVGSNRATQAAGSGSGQASGSIRFHARGGAQEEFYQTIAEQFMESSDGEINVEPILSSGTDEYLQKLAAMVAGGTVGDAMWTASIYNYYEYIASGSFRSIDDFVEADDFDTSVFFPEGIEGCRVDGKLYGLPWATHPGRCGLYYNKEAFDEVGVPYPSADWTYDDFFEAGEALMKEEGGQVTRFGFLPGSQPYFDLVIPLRSYGGDWINQEGTAPTFADDGFEGLKTFTSVFNERQISPTSGAQADFGFGEIFTSGLAAMWQTGYWGIGAVQSNADFDWDVAPLPQGPAGMRTMFEFDSNTIVEGTENAQLAWDFIKMTHTKDAGILIGELGSVPGGRPDVWESDELMEQKGHAVWADMIANNADPLSVPQNYRIRELFVEVDKVLAPVYAGEKTVDALAEDLKATMQGVLQKPPPG